MFPHCSATRARFAYSTSSKRLATVRNRNDRPTRTGNGSHLAQRSQSTAASQQQRQQQQKLRIGVIGGMSYTSTITYYRELNRLAQQRAGGLASCDLALRSVNFADIEERQRAGDWASAGEILKATATDLRRAGADFVILATNTMHKCADAIERELELYDKQLSDRRDEARLCNTDDLGRLDCETTSGREEAGCSTDASNDGLTASGCGPRRFLHLADATGAAIRAAGFSRPGLLATAYTMEQDFYTGRLMSRHSLKTILPCESDRKVCHDIIFRELCKDIIEESSRKRFEALARSLHERGADCLILGCTEIGLLLDETNCGFMPLFDTAKIHCIAAVDLAFRGEL